MRKLVTRALSLVLGIVFSTVAFAQTTVFDLNEDFTTDVTNWGFTQNNGGVQTISYNATNKALQVRWPNSSSEYIKTLATAITAGTDNKMNVEFIVKAYTSGNASNYGALYLMDESGNAITGFHVRRGSVGGSNKWFVGRATSYPGTTTYSYPSSADPLNANEPLVKITFALDFATKTVSFTAQQGTFDYTTRVFTASGASVSSTDQPFINAAATNIKSLNSWYFRASSASGTNGFDLMYAGISASRSVSTATVTVKFKDQNNTYFKSDEVIEGHVAGTAYNATIAQKDSYFDGTNYYVLNQASPIRIESVDGAGSTLELLFTKSLYFSTMKWNGSTATDGTIWSEAYPNFISDTTPTGFQTGSGLSFDASAEVKNVVLNESVKMGTGTVTITAPDYVFTGEGAITGAGNMNINLSSGNALSLGVTNLLSGTTQISGGDITLSKNGALGNAAQINGPTSIILGAGSITLPALTVDAPTSIITGNNASSLINNLTTSSAVKISIASEKDHGNNDSSRAFDLAANGTLASGTEIELNGTGTDNRMGMNAASANYLANAKLSLKGAAMFYINANQGGATTINIGSLAGESGTKLGWGRSVALDRDITWSVGALNTDSEFAGTITNTGGYATSGLSYNGNYTHLTKVGTGRLTLSGTSNTYNGNITVNDGELMISGTVAGNSQTTAPKTNTVTVGAAGTLLVNGNLKATTINVVAGGTLKGTGTITGKTTVNGLLSGRLTFANELTLNDSLYITVSGFADGEYDVVEVQDSLIAGGSLKVAVTVDAPANNTSIQIIKATKQSGNFSLKDLPEGYSFNDATGYLTYNTVTTGAADINKGLKIFPAITNGLVTVEGANIQSVRIFNLAGQLTETQLVNSDQIIINLSTRPKGIYVLRVELKDGSSNLQKVILN